MSSGTIITPGNDLGLPQLNIKSAHSWSDVFLGGLGYIGGSVRIVTMIHATDLLATGNEWVLVYETSDADAGSSRLLHSFLWRPAFYGGTAPFFAFSDIFAIWEEISTTPRRERHRQIDEGRHRQLDSNLTSGRHNSYS
jgi:hypothetical protein